MKSCSLIAVLHRLTAIVFAIAVSGCPLIASALGISITNQAGAVYRDVASSVQTMTSSNTVQALQADAPLRASTIRYYRDAGFTIEAATARVGDPLFVEADAPACNAAAEAAETVMITITSAVTGDSETMAAIETGPNTGRFRIGSRVMLQDHAIHPATSGNGMMETRKNDLLRASIGGCGAGTQANILIDPSGVVFDSRSNQPVAGAMITLIDVTGAGNGGNAGAPARVFAEDGITPAPSTVTTNTDGVYRFALVAPGSYRLAVTAPPHYIFPSQQAPEQLSSTRTVHRFGSYGAPFPVDATTGAVTLDVPLDPAIGVLAVDKKASRTSVDVGDFVDYAVTVKNNSGGALNGIIVSDTLPRGFSYESGSARVNGVKIGDPDGTRAKREFALGDLAGGGTSTLTYRLSVAAAALQGDGINRAVAVSGTPAITSNTASTQVKVQAGVFSGQAYIVGQVYIDCDGNRLRNAGEPGIPGVRLYLENGSYAVTDGDGKFSFYNVAARTHILKLDPSTLPAGSRLVTLSNRNAGDPGSRFVDLKNGELHKADFAEGSCTAEILREVGMRRAKLGRDEDDRKLRLPQAEKTSPRSETDLSRVDNTIGFIDLDNGSILPQAQTTVRVKGPAGATLQLAVNGRVLSEQRVGQRSVLAARDLAVWDYIGVDLMPGENALVVSAVDAFDNPRGPHMIKVIAPGPPAKLTLTPARATAPADGKSGINITIRLADAQGTPVAARTAVTLHTSAGTWQVSDLDKKEAGTQIFIEGGQAELMLNAPADPAEARLRAESGTLATEAKVSFVPELRAPIVAGIIEGRLNVRKFDGLLPARRNDGFEEELSQFSRSAANGEIGARAALFLKGKVKGDYLLTLAYDSDKDTQEKLFRDIKPDEFYPVYGDSAEKGFDAQSASRLYLRVAKDKSWLLYGDFVTPAATSVRNLGAYSRSLTGLREHFERGPLVVDAFASQDSTRQIVEEIPANGTSGPFQLGKSGFVSNSEQVEIVTRDRNQPGIILKTVPQARFSDYQIDTLTGRLLFSAPVASLDANLNPVSIRITYEIDLGGANFWIAGIAAQVKVNDALEVGGSVVTDRNPQDPSTLGSVNASIKLTERTSVVAEIAQTGKLSSGTGRGERVEIKHAGDQWEARAHVGRTDLAFDNPSAGFDKGRSEAGVKASYKIADDTRMAGEYIRSEDLANHAQRAGALVGVERTLGQGVRLEVGLRHVRQLAATGSSIGNTAVPAQPDIDALRVKLTAPVPGMAQANVYGEAEQDVHDSARRLLAVGGEYRFENNGRLYGRHEIISSLGSNYALDNQQRRYATVIGLDAEYMKDGRSFSEYRAGNALDGRGAEAAIGLRNRWNLAEGLRLDTTVERVQVVSGADQNQSAAGTVAIAYTRNPRWKGTARLELRSGQASDGVFSTLGLGYKFTDTWAFLGRNRYALTRNKDTTAGNKTDEWLQLGVAYRALETSGWNGLAKYEYKLEKDTGVNDVDRIVHLVSTHANYQPDRHTVLSGRYAAKLALDRSNGMANRGNAQLIGGRITHDLYERWDIGLVAYLLMSGGAQHRQTGIGTELGYLAQENLWLSMGYNLSGFYDRDLAAQGETRKGLYVRLRFKFDEHSLQGLLGKPSASSRD